MRIRSTRVFEGPNLYALYPVVRLTLDLGPLEDYPSDRLEGFNERLLEAVPTLAQHGCCYGRAGGFVRRLRSGTWMGHILEHLALALQNLAGGEVSFGKTRGTGRAGEYHVVYACIDGPIGLAAGKAARRILLGLLPPDVVALLPRKPGVAPHDPAREIADFVQFAERRQLGPTTQALVRAAEARGIPWFRLDEGSLVQLGTGRYQRRIEASLTGRTPGLAVDIAGNKERARGMLADAGLPVPVQRRVRSPDEALRAAEELGWPVVVKPLDGNHGRGVTACVEGRVALKAAFRRAREVRREVLVETWIPGADHRLLVVDGALIAAARREPAAVRGDGLRTVRELVEAVNADPRRGTGHEAPLTRITLDEEARRLLAERGLTEDSVPAPDERVPLAATGNLSTGGTAVDVTDRVHPDNRRLAERAARVIGLDVAGIDFITPDVTRSWREVGGGICEINAAPGLRMHLSPCEGAPRDVAGPIVDMLFPPGRPVAAHVTAVTGTNGKTTTARMVAHIHELDGRVVGLASTDGISIDGELTVAGDMTGPVGARMVLGDPTSEVAVLEVARGGLLRAGLGTPYCDVGAVLNVTSDHLGFRGIETVEDMAYLKRVVVEAAREAAVLNADDLLTLAMTYHTRARHVVLVTMDPGHARVRAHVREGGRAVILEPSPAGEAIVIHDGADREVLIAAAEIPATLGGCARHNLQNAMFAAALTHAAGVSLQTIREGLRTFQCTFGKAPGRLNVYDEHPFRVILDYAHNQASFKAMGELVTRLGIRGRRLCVVGLPGNRRDEDLRACARELVGQFDLFLLRDEQDLRGRRTGEVPDLIAEELRGAGVAPDAIRHVHQETAAIRAACEEANEGDLVVVFAERLEEAWTTIATFEPELAGLAPPTDLLSLPSERKLARRRVG